MTNAVSSIYAHNLTHTYGDRTALEPLHLDIKTGEFYGFLGQNGAGKSTAIRLLCGFQRPQQGEIRVADVDVVANPAEVRRHIGILSEDIALYERLSGAEFLEFVGQMHGLSRAESKRRSDELLERMELTDAAHRPIAAYSLGMKKKTALSAALIHGPRVLFLDEPFNGVDALSASGLCLLLKRLTEERGVTVFFTSHILDMAERLCTRLAILHDGKKLCEGTVAEIKAQAGQQDATLESVFFALTGMRPQQDAPPDWF